MSNIAVIGAGISGLASAHYLEKSGHRVALFEADSRFGGHAHTVDVTLDGVTAGVDTGFLVCNDRTYPNLLNLFSELDVALAASDMSFAVRSDQDNLEWSGTSLAAVFAQRRNLLRPRFLRFLRDILRFNEQTTALVNTNAVPEISLTDFLSQQGYGRELFDWYLWPMVGSVWSSPRGDVMNFELPMLLRFCHNHGLLAIRNRPQWMTVRGGSREYVKKIVAGLSDARTNAAVEKIVRTPAFVEIHAKGKSTFSVERFDYAVIATHTDQARKAITQLSPRENKALSAIAYQSNRCVLHTDAALMPKRRAAWSSWNYLQTTQVSEQRPVALTYWLNQLQPLPFKTPLFETLNPPFEPDRSKVIAEFEYSHPLLNQTAIAAQSEVRALQGEQRTYYAGAWLYNGFHEDGIRSALDIVSLINHRSAAQSRQLAAE